VWAPKLNESDEIKGRKNVKKMKIKPGKVISIFEKFFLLQISFDFKKRNPRIYLFTVRPGTTPNFRIR